MKTFCKVTPLYETTEPPDGMIAGTFLKWEKLSGGNVKRNQNQPVVVEF